MRLPTIISLIALSAALGACATAPIPEPVAGAQATAAPTRPIPTQLPRNARPLHYRIAMAPDPANLRYSATVTIDVELLEAGDEITLNAADIEFGAVRLRRSDGSEIAAQRVETNADAQTATIHFQDRLMPGRYSLMIEYRGRIYTQASGFFALDYDSETGRKRALFTQFQAPDARRFVPSWDEPAFRTPWDLQVTVPAGQSAIGNMPEAGRERRPDGSEIVTFQTTPPMSSYLLFLGVGEFDRITATAAGTELGIVTRRGSGEQGRFALDQSVRVMPWFTEYFGTPYPLPKLDNVAGPGSSQQFAAMENWGAIFSFEPYLLIDPAITTEAERQFTYEVLVHEIAHQWFGNLVTIAWWDDIWLNESFASWITAKATEELMPQWDPAVGRVGSRETAMTLDSLASARPVVREVRTVEEMNQLFDAITYQKGEMVITMLEDFVGEAAWREGVRAYLRRYRLHNTISEQFFETMEQASGLPVTAVAHDFTRQPGIPLIRVESADCRRGRTRIALTQAEFSRDRFGAPPRRWRVPVTAAVADRASQTLVEGGQGAMDLAGCGTPVVNAGQRGYFRTLYGPTVLPQLKRGFARLAPVDQVGILADQWALGLGGYQSAADAMDFIDAIPANGHAQLWIRAAGILSGLHSRYPEGSDERRQVAVYASRKLAPVLDRLGWSPRREEADDDRLLRAVLIGTLGGMGERTVVVEATRRFELNDPSVQSGPLRTTILGVVATHIDETGWRRIHEQARTAQAPQVRRQLYRLLGSARDETLARRALALALTDEPGATNSADMISAVAAVHPDLAFDFALQNREAVRALVDIASREEFIPILATGSSRAETAVRVRDYAERYMTASSRAVADTAIATIEDRVRVRETRLPDISRWLAAKNL